MKTFFCFREDSLSAMKINRSDLDRFEQDISQRKYTSLYLLFIKEAKQETVVDNLILKIDVKTEATQMTFTGSDVGGETEFTSGDRRQFRCHIDNSIRNGISVGWNGAIARNTVFLEVFRTSFSPGLADVTIIARTNIIDTRYFDIETADLLLHCQRDLKNNTRLTRPCAGEKSVLTRMSLGSAELTTALTPMVRLPERCD